MPKQRVRGAVGLCFTDTLPCFLVCLVDGCMCFEHHQNVRRFCHRESPLFCFLCSNPSSLAYLATTVVAVP